MHRRGGGKYLDHAAQGAYLDTYPSKNTDSGFFDISLAATVKRDGSAFRL